MLSVMQDPRGLPRQRGLATPDAQEATMRAFLLVCSPGLAEDGLTACLRRLDPECEVACAESGAGGFHVGRGAAPSLVLVDLDAPQMDRTAVIRRYVTGLPGVPVVALGSATDDAVIDAVLRAGAVAYIPRLYTENQMLHVLRLTLDGAGHRPHFPGQRTVSDAEGDLPTPVAARSTEDKPAARGHRLTPKQVEVLSLAADGLSNKQIAARLQITEGTAKLHMSAIYEKLNVNRRGKAIVLARRMDEVRSQQVRQAERGAQVLDWLLPHVTHRHLRSGDVIFRKGEPGSELYYIQRGTVSLEEIGVEMGAREILGEIGVFSPEHRRTGTARCRTEVDLFCLGSDQVKSIYYLNPQFALHMIHLIAQRLLADRERIEK